MQIKILELLKSAINEKLEIVDENKYLHLNGFENKNAVESKIKELKERLK